MYHQLLASALGMGWLQWLAFVFSLSYVILAARESHWCWPVGIVGVVFSFFVYIKPEVRLYSDAILQIFYLVVSFYGWWVWWQSEREDVEVNGGISISTLSIGYHLAMLLVGSLLALLLGRMWQYFGAALPYVDAFTTAFSIIATVMVTRKILENWLYWIVIDAVCIFVYLHRELYLFSFLFFIYCVVAMFGFTRWWKSYQEA